MILTEITDYKLKLRLYINGLGSAFAAFFSVLQFSTGHLQLGSISLLCACYFAGIVHFLRKKNHYLWRGRVALLILPATILYAIYANPEYGVYWIYVTVAVLFLLLTLVDAAIGTAIFVLICFYLIAPHFNQDILYRIYGTVILSGLVSGIFSLLIDRLLARLNGVATRDPLTKALNRHTFHTAIEIAQEEHQRYQITAILYLFDLDFFKKVNDVHGHLAGDKILQEVSDIVHARVRKSDQFFRYGGEEFAILLRHTSLQNAVHLAEDLRTQIQEHKFCNDIKVTVSGGLSEVQQGDDVNAWIDRSDAALYEAKSAGRNCNKINITDLDLLRE